MNLEAMALKRTPLCEGLFTEITFVGTDTCMCPCVSFQIKSVIETFPTESAKVAFSVTVTLHMSVQ